ncbi:MAG: hypothetical protein ACRD07_01700, partial [Acidimicrobiales bacterium]
DYQRVTVRGVEPATIVGAAAADLAHLLAELIENALVFSPPDQIVDIRGRFRPGVGPHGSQALPPTRGRDRLPGRARDGDGEPDRQGVYTLAIIDSGLGMTAADSEAANRRLAGEESFTIAPSKYLGHYVAGNLAARHGIGVRLDHSPGSGITATVHIPPALLTTDAVTSAPVTPPQGMRPSGVGLRGGGPALPPPPAREPVPAAWPPDPTSPPAPPWGPVEPATLSSGYEPAAPARSVFDGPASGEPQPPPWLPPSNQQPTRTASGLVKRPSRPGEGVTPPAAAAHTDPNQDLLASLGRIAGTNRSREQAVPPAPGAGAPRGPRGNAWPPPWAEAIGSEPGDGRLDLRSTGPVVPPPRAPGLTRRVRGAQLPSTDPTLVRRTWAGGDGPPASGSAPGRSAPAASDGRRSPDDVYSFLTSFTAGVQRGLDETQPRPGPPDN